MEKQYSLDLEPQTSEPTSTSLDGQSSTQETQVPKGFNLVYEDDSVTVYHHVVEEDKHTIHCDFKQVINHTNLEHFRTIQILMEDTFKNYGINKLYAWSITPEQEALERFMGYMPTGKEVVMEGYDGPTIYENCKEF